MRDEVKRFAKIMEAQLAANDHKPGWKGDQADDLLTRLLEEAEELQDAINGSSSCHCREAACPHWLHVESARVAKEAADVANFAMMIADVCGGLAAHDAAVQGRPAGDGGGS